MGNKGIIAATAALAQILGPKGSDKPADKGAEPEGSAALEELKKLLVGLEDKIAEIESTNEKTGKRIDAWNELPSGSAQSIAEAREIITIVDGEIDLVRGLLQKLDRARKVAKRVTGAAVHVEALYVTVDSWRRDLDADKEALMVASRDVIVREARADGQKGNGVVEIPLPVQVERALADAYQRRDAREDEAAAAKMLPSPAERGSVAQKLLESIAQDAARQVELERRVQGIIENVRSAESLPPPELRAAADQLKAWGMSLAFEKGRVEQLRR